VNTGGKDARKNKGGRFKIGYNDTNNEKQQKRIKYSKEK